MACSDGLGARLTGTTWGIIDGQVDAPGWGDAYVAKYNAEGNERWTRQFGTSHEESGDAIATDDQGAVLVGGTTIGAFPGQTSERLDAFVIKFAP